MEYYDDDLLMEDGGELVALLVLFIAVWLLFIPALAVLTLMVWWPVVQLFNWLY